MNNKTLFDAIDGLMAYDIGATQPLRNDQSMVEYRGDNNHNVVSFWSKKSKERKETINTSMSELVERAMQTSDGGTCNDTGIVLRIVSSFAALFAVSFVIAFIVIRLAQ